VKALLSHAPGPPETLRLDEIADPTPGPGELLIAVRAVGVNYPDVLIIQDLYQFKPPRPFAPGGEIAGVVEAVGDGAVGWSPGDRVIAVTGWGGMAEKAVVAAARCLPLPPDMPFADGAAILMTYGTSHHALVDRARLQAGETLLVLGAAGGVGLAAVELGRALGRARGGRLFHGGEGRPGAVAGRRGGGGLRRRSGGRPRARRALQGRLRPGRRGRRL
jgi:NADPH2:quinone reductase